MTCTSKCSVAHLVDGTIGHKKCGSIDEVSAVRPEQDAKADESEAYAND